MGRMSGKLYDEIQQTKPFRSLEEEAFLNLWRTSNHLVGCVDRVLRKAGLTRDQYNALRILRGAEPHGLVPRRVGERMVASPPDPVRFLARLEKRALICRSRGPEPGSGDGKVRITDAGLELVEDLDLPIGRLLEELLGHLGNPRLRSLIGLLEETRGGRA